MNLRSRLGAGNQFFINRNDPSEKSTATNNPNPTDKEQKEDGMLKKAQRKMSLNKMRTADCEIYEKYSKNSKKTGSIRSILKPSKSQKDSEGQAQNSSGTPDSKKKKVKFHKKKSIYKYHPKSRIARFNSKGLAKHR